MRSVAATVWLLACSWIAVNLFAAEPLIEPVASSPAGSGPKAFLAAIAPPIEITLADVRWQALPEQIESAAVSPDQRVWYIVRGPSRSPQMQQAEIQHVVEREFAKPSPQLQGIQGIFFETPGTSSEQQTKLKRVWVFCREVLNCDLLLGYDGKQWIERRAKHSAFLSRSHGGKTFHQLEDGLALLDERGCHVLKGAHWSYQDVLDTVADKRYQIRESRVWVDADGKGLVVLAQAGGPVSLWRYREGTWRELPALKDLGPVLLPTKLVRFGEYLYIRSGGYFAPRNPGSISAPDSDLIRRQLGPPTLMRIGLDGKVDKIDGEELLDVGPYRVPLKSPMSNACFGRFYAVCEDVVRQSRRLGPGTVICDPSGKARHVAELDPAALGLFDDLRVTVPLQGGKRAWIGSQLWDMEELKRIDGLPEDGSAAVAALEDGTTFAKCLSQFMVYRPTAPDPRAPLAGHTVEFNGRGLCVASDGCIWSYRGNFGLERFDGKKWLSCGKPIKGAEESNLQLEPYSLIPAQNGWVFTYLGDGSSEIRPGAVLGQLFGPQYFLVNGEKCLGNPSLGQWIIKHREEFLEAFSQPCANLPWYAHRPMVAREVGGGMVVVSPLDVRGDRVVVDKAKNIWVNALGALTVVSGTRVVDVSIPGDRSTPADRLGIVKSIAPLGDGEFVFLRLEDGNTFFARLTPNGEVDFVEGPKLTNDGPDHPIGTLRDQQGGLWVTLHPPQGYEIEDGRLRGTIVCRLTATDKGQDFREIGVPELVDASGCVWLAPRTGIGGDLVTIWAPTGETSTLKIPSRNSGSFFVAGPKGVVFARTALGLQECVAEDPGKPGKYELGKIYRLETLEGASVNLSFLQYSSLGYLVTGGYRQSVDSGSVFHLFPLDQTQWKHDSAPAAAKSRTWTDVTGQFSVEAEFVGAAAGIVALRKDNGSTIKVPIEKLSDPDRQYIQERSR